MEMVSVAGRVSGLLLTLGLQRVYALCGATDTYEQNTSSKRIESTCVANLNLAVTHSLKAELDLADNICACPLQRFVDNGNIAVLNQIYIL